MPEALGAHPEQKVLDNGLRVLLLDLPGADLVATALLYRVGTLAEPAGQEGIAHFLEHMMFRGSAGYPAGEVDRRTLSLGGDNNAFTSHDCTVYHFSFARDRWEEALAIEADRMRGLLLDPADVATEAGVILEEIALHEEDPWSSLEQKVRERSHGGHGYGRSVLGRAESVASLKSAQLAEFHRQCYGPDNAVLAVAGDLGEAALDRIRARFGELAARGSRPAEGTPGDGPARKAGRVVTRRGEVARLIASVPAPEATHSDHPSLRLLTALLGTGRASRLARILVDDLQLCSDVGCDVSETVQPGSWTIEAEVLPGVSPEEVEKRVFEELDRAGSEAPSQKELERAKAVVGADWIFANERVLDRALTLGLTIGQFGPDYLQRSAAALSTCDAERLLEMTRRYLAPEASWVVGWSLPEGA